MLHFVSAIYLLLTSFVSDLVWEYDAVVPYVVLHKLIFMKCYYIPHKSTPQLN